MMGGDGGCRDTEGMSGDWGCRDTEVMGGDGGVEIQRWWVEMGV